MWKMLIFEAEIEPNKYIKDVLFVQQQKTFWHVFIVKPFSHTVIITPPFGLISFEILYYIYGNTPFVYRHMYVIIYYQFK